MNANDTNIINEVAANVYSKVMSRLERDEEADVAEYVAYRLLKAVEGASPTCDLARHIANKIVNDYTLPHGSAIILKRYFDLAF